MEKKKYRVPMTGRVDTEIEVYATNKQDAIKLAYEESEKDTFRPDINLYYDTTEEDVEEIDELEEKIEDAVASVMGVWTTLIGDELMDKDWNEYCRQSSKVHKSAEEMFKGLLNQEVKEVA